MTKKRTTKPKDVRATLADHIDSAITACRMRGAQMTPLRVAVLSALWSADRPLGAYEMRDLVSKSIGRKIAAASVYRALDFLCAQGAAARIESRNAYVACKHPSHEHACVFLVCESCGDAKEIENPKVEQLIDADAKRLGFTVKHRVVELSGFCAPCQKGAALTAHGA
ncbi:MAG: Fur family transcriptional regulator [Pseudomonadota bacterium]